MISRGRGVDSRNTLRTRRERSGAGFHRDLGARGEELGPAAELSSSLSRLSDPNDSTVLRRMALGWTEDANLDAVELPATLADLGNISS